MLECRGETGAEGGFPAVGNPRTRRAAAIDAAVETHVLEALTQEQLDITLAVLNELENQAAEIEHTWQLRFERARYEAERTFRQFDAVSL